MLRLRVCNSINIYCPFKLCYYYYKASGGTRVVWYVPIILFAEYLHACFSRLHSPGIEIGIFNLTFYIISMHAGYVRSSGTIVIKNYHSLNCFHISEQNRRQKIVINKAYRMQYMYI